ncbi:unnamed protein product [Symbiodinium natans]|uniref:Uncharacterized protein n=1 Tax=Symbiodinium natans TaxID=878477 RepID=A0A812JFU3_9DINO|nr:unnamed protein product [Symbiodinium natans]
MAEITVLRSRLQAFERENTRLENELVAKDCGPSKQSQRQELERIQSELQYARQDLISSEDERKRLRLTVQKMQQEMEELKAHPAVEKPVPTNQPPKPEPKPAPKPAEPAPQQLPSVPPSKPSNLVNRPVQEHRSCDEPVNEDMTRHHVAILIGLAERWNADNLKQRLALQAAVASFPHAVREASSAATELLQEGLKHGHWILLSAGATFLKHWFGLFPLHVSEIAEMVVKGQATTSIFCALAAVLHSAVLDPASCEDEEALEALALQREACAREVLAALSETSTKLPGSLMAALSPVLEKPSLFALICEDPAPDSLHLPTLRLLEALMASPDLFTLAHQAETDENILLAVANVLVIPSVAKPKLQAMQAEAEDVEEPEACEDTLERQECRVAGLELLQRCLATAPSPDFVLQLRGAVQGAEVDTVDTVLQRVVLLCHHELLCLRLGARSPQRTQAAELSLFILSGWLWHGAPHALSASAEQSRELCLQLCNQLGRTRILIESIVEMVQVLGSQQCFKSFLSSAAALRTLIPFVDGETTPVTGRRGGEDCASTPVVVT